MLKTYGRVLTSVSSLNQLFPKSLNLSIFRPYCLALHILKSTLSCSLTQLHLSNATSLSAPVSTTPVSTEILLHYYHSSVFLLTSQSKLCGRRRKCGPNKTFPKTFVMQPEKKKKKHKSFLLHEFCICEVMPDKSWDSVCFYTWNSQSFLKINAVSSFQHDRSGWNYGVLYSEVILM